MVQRGKGLLLLEIEAVSLNVLVGLLGESAD